MMFSEEGIDFYVLKKNFNDKNQLYPDNITHLFKRKERMIIYKQCFIDVY